MKPLLLILIVIAALALVADTLAQTKARSDLSKLEPPSWALRSQDNLLKQFAAAAPEQRKKLLGSFLASGEPNRAAELIAAATPDLRKALLDAIVQIVRDVVSAPVPRSMEDNHRLVNCAGALRAASDDDATLAAFTGNLNRLDVWEVEHFAIEALSRCRNPRAVDLMGDLARARIKESRKWLPKLSPSASEAERTAAVAKATSLFSAIQGLAMSTNRSGKVVARQLRDVFIKLFDGNPYREALLRDIETELDPLLRAAPQTVSPRSHASFWPGWIAAAAIPCLLGLLLWHYRGNMRRHGQSQFKQN